MSKTKVFKDYMAQRRDAIEGESDDGEGESDDDVNDLEWDGASFKIAISGSLWGNHFADGLDATLVLRTSG